MKLTLVMFIFFIIRLSIGATYFVSNSGSASWINSTNISTPSSPVTAFNNASAGDTVYFRGGTYSLTGDGVNSNYTGTSSYQGRLQPANSGTSGNYIVFMAYPDEIPILDVDWKPDNVARLGRALGTNGADYIVFDGFKIISEGGERAGSIIISGHDAATGSNNCIVKNCDIYGGSLGVNDPQGSYWGDNVEGIRIEKTENIIIENNNIYGFIELTADAHNTSGTKSYDTYNTIYRNNNFYNNSNDLYIKGSGNTLMFIYNNYFYSSHNAIMAANKSNVCDSLSIYNNVLRDIETNGMVDDTDYSYTMNSLKIYNNTFVNVGSDAYPNFIASNCTAGLEADIYNNIFYHESSGITNAWTRNNINPKTFDHNCFYPTIKIIISIYSSAHTYTNLGTWQASGELEGRGNPGSGSLVSNPIFVNGSGNLNKLTDFALDTGSPCLGAGRSSADMGADVSLVGVGLNFPSSPSNIQIVR